MTALTIVVIVLTLAQNITASKISSLVFKAHDRTHVNVSVVFESQEQDKQVTNLILYQRKNLESIEDKYFGRFLQDKGRYEMTARMSACDKQEGLYIKYTDMSPGRQKKPGQSSPLFEYTPENINICRQNYNGTIQGKISDEKTNLTESAIAIGVGAGAGGLAILALTLFLVLCILKKRRTAPSGGRKIVDQNPLYHTYYAGDEKLNDTAEVNMSGNIA